jgi:hypothetical protein
MSEEEPENKKGSTNSNLIHVKACRHIFPVLVKEFSYKKKNRVTK